MIAIKVRRTAAAAALVLIALGTLAPSVGGASAASIALSPSQALPGATVSVTGRRFDAHATGTITLDGSSVASFRTSSSGAFSGSFVVPAGTPVGSHLVRAATAAAAATATLTVTSSPTPAPTASPTVPPNPPSPTPAPSPGASGSPSPGPGGSASPSIGPLPGDPGDIGTRGPSYPSSVTAPTGQKPQSKLWINDGSWWGDLFDASTGRFEIERFDWASNTWITTGTAIDERPASSADVLWQGSHLYVVSAIADETNSSSPPTGGDLGIRFSRYSYDAGARSYSLDAGFPVVVATGAVEAAVLDRDTAGVVWITWTASNGSGGRQVLVTHTTSDDAHWSTPFVPPVSGATNLTSDDISALASYGGRIGLMWSNQNDSAMYFASHRDGDPDTTWTQNPALQGPKYADDHISLRSFQGDPSGRLFAAVKTSLDALYPNSQQPLILLLTLDATGAWSRTTFGTVSDGHTRPIVMIDRENGQADVFATASTSFQTVNGVTYNGGTIYYKSTSLARPAFATGLGTAFIRRTSITASLVNNATSTKQPVDSTTGLLVLASDDGLRMYMQDKLAIPPHVDTPPTASNGSVSVAPGGTVTGTLSANDPDGDPLTFSIVSNGSQGTATVTNAATGAFQYTAGANASGSDSFTFKASDGRSDSNVATESVAIAPPSGVRGTWLMNEGSGSTLLDSSGLGNDATLTGAPAWTTGKEGLALQLDGATYGTCPASSSLDITGSITIAAWIRPTRVATAYLVKKAILGTSDGYELSLSSSGKVFFRLDQASHANTYRVDSTTSYPVDGSTWMHVAATFDGSTMRLYVNGVLEGSLAGPTSIASNGTALGIGAQPDGTSGFVGTIDEARLWARALSAAEVQALLAQ